MRNGLLLHVHLVLGGGSVRLGGQAGSLGLLLLGELLHGVLAEETQSGLEGEAGGLGVGLVGLLELLGLLAGVVGAGNVLDLLQGMEEEMEERERERQTSWW